MTKNKKMMISALPFVALVVLLAVFCGIVSSKGYRLDMYITPSGDTSAKSGGASSISKSAYVTEL